MPHKLYLTVVEPKDDDTVLSIATPDGVLFKGDEDENLACGACKIVIARGVTTRTIHSRFIAETRLVARCKCGAHNLLPASPTS